ncbi:hypothetical protein AVEN_194634-1 [Araneus ventricosus]|uniref:Uncharacterized protein n=1 Tax=Araneus ventricosus TaxID=182803 RepID=A0A4Y2A825_ARAVE|nr:hypothetical protein AVEN_194634-1 [Araneus ventricosus]
MCKHIHAFCLKENLFCNSHQIAQSASSNDKAIKEKQAILTEKPKFDKLKDLKSSAVSLIMNLVPEIQEYSEEQCKEFIKGITVLKHKCEAIKSAEKSYKTLPPVASTSSVLKKVKPQRSFPIKKQKSVKKLQASYKQADTLKNILLSKPETYEVASTHMSLDHTYSENV